MQVKCSHGHECCCVTDRENRDWCFHVGSHKPVGTSSKHCTCEVGNCWVIDKVVKCVPVIPEKGGAP